MPTPFKPIEERFWLKVEKRGPDECWTWHGAKDAHGYGRIEVGLPSKRGTKIMAHRLSREIHFGKIPDGLLVLHDCDNTSCVNPGHLSVGDQSKNMADAGVRGRVRRGETHHYSKLTCAQAVEIYASKESGVLLAKQYGVSPSTVKDIRKGKVWRHACGAVK